MDIEKIMIRGACLVRVAVLFAVVFSAAGCQPSRTLTAPRGSTLAFEEPGADVARHLNNRYRETTADTDKYTECRGLNGPDFVCSGVLIRGKNPPASGHAWDLDPTSQKYPDSVSFSWLRQDVPTIRLAFAYNAGFIFYPKKYAQSHGMTSIEVLCAFPIDGDSDARTVEAAHIGCGTARGYRGTSGLCQTQSPPIVNAAQWRAHFDLVSGNPDQFRHQCGFDVSKSAVGTGTKAIFRESLIARRGLQLANYGSKANELVLRGWSVGTDVKLPIEAWFYWRNGVDDGRLKAQGYQLDFCHTTGRWVPIVEMILPTGGNTSPIAFQYTDADQAVTSARCIKTSP